MRDRIDNCLVHRIEIELRKVLAPGVLTCWPKHKTLDEAHCRVDLIASTAMDLLNVHQVIGGQPFASIACRLDVRRRQEALRVNPEREQARDGWPIEAAVVGDGHARVAQEVRPVNRGRGSEEVRDLGSVQVLARGSVDWLLIEDVGSTSLLQQPGQLLGT